MGLWDEDKLKAFNQTHPDSIDTRPLNGGKSIKDSNKNLTGYYFLEITIIDELFPLKFNFVNNALFVESIVSAYR